MVINCRCYRMPSTSGGPFLNYLIFNKIAEGWVCFVPKSLVFYLLKVRVQYHQLWHLNVWSFSINKILPRTIGNLLMLGPWSAYEGYQTQKLVTHLLLSQMCEWLISSHIGAAIIVFVEESFYASHHTPFFWLGIVFSEAYSPFEGFANKVPEASNCPNSCAVNFTL